jgi:hypothetical protein
MCRILLFSHIVLHIFRGNVRLLDDKTSLGNTLIILQHTRGKNHICHWNVEQVKFVSGQILFHVESTNCLTPEIRYDCSMNCSGGNSRTLMRVDNRQA